jgi:hypothetical protein
MLAIVLFLFPYTYLFHPPILHRTSKLSRGRTKSKRKPTSQPNPSDLERKALATRRRKTTAGSETNKNDEKAAAEAVLQLAAARTSNYDHGSNLGIKREEYLTARLAMHQALKRQSPLPTPFLPFPSFIPLEKKKSPSYTPNNPSLPLVLTQIKGAAVPNINQTLS